MAKNLEPKLLRHRKEEEVGVGSVLRRGRAGQTSLFDSVVVVAFQMIFHAKLYVNGVFLFLKNYF